MTTTWARHYTARENLRQRRYPSLALVPGLPRRWGVRLDGTSLCTALMVIDEHPCRAMVVYQGAGRGR